MTEDVRRIVKFRGGVSCRRDESPLGLTLIGRTTDRPDEMASLAFTGVAPADLPGALEDATVERLNSGRFRIWSGRREWIVCATACHLHREISTTFYQAIPPRAAPWQKRVFWRLVLAMVANPAGKRLLMSLRRR